MTAKLAITCGDPAGIGPEIIATWLATYPDETDRVVIVGPESWLSTLPPGVEFVAVGLDDFAAVPGQPTAEGALVAWAALEWAAAGCQRGQYAGVVTGPVSKEAMAWIGWKFPGQTEFFAERWGGAPTMAFCGGQLRVVLVTWHLPLQLVPAQMTAVNLERAVRAADQLARVFAEPGVDSPRIGVCGLNPHAGEGGVLGTEEHDLIDPVLNQLRLEFPNLSRTQPGDTIFARQLQGEFDVIVALYHDQGLAPLKTVDFDESVNVTLGLPFVRTSPDHGTAFTLAGRGEARITSFANAVTVARRLIKYRERP